jgi:hypothetical protein
VHPFASAIAAAVAVSISAPLIAPAPAQAKVEFDMRDNTVRVWNDGEAELTLQGFSESCGLSIKLWDDPKVAYPFPNKPKSSSYPEGTGSIFDKKWDGTAIESTIRSLRTWVEQSRSQQAEAIHPDDRSRFLNGCGAPSDIPVKQANPDGCPAGQQRIYVDRSTGFLGLGKKKVDIGCMTESEYNRWWIENQNRQQPTYIPPTYQPRRNCTSNIVGNQVFTNCY